MSLTGTQLTFTTPQPATNGAPTSQAAAKRIAPTAGTLRASILAYLQAAPHHGATDEEMQIDLHMNPSTQRPRRQELEKMGWVVRTARTRLTRSGRHAVVFVASDAGVEAQL